MVVCNYCVEPTSPKQLNPSWIHAALAAAVLAAAMGIGRFAYTPILPLMTAQAGLTAKAGATLATANYVGYLAGALAGTASSRVARSHLAHSQLTGPARRNAGSDAAGQLRSRGS